MSEWIYVWMAAFDRRDPLAKQRVGGDISLEAVPGLLTKISSAKQGATELQGALRYLHATARNGCFQWEHCKQLFDAMGTVDSLRFFSQELYTYSKFWGSDEVKERRYITSDEIDQIKDYDFDGGGYHQYYVFDKSKYQSIIDDIDRLLKWSVEHPEIIAPVFGWHPGCESKEKIEQDVVMEIEAVPVFIPEANEVGVEVGFDDSGLRFTYRMFKAVRNLLEYANATGLDAVYYNGMPNSGYEWWASIMERGLQNPLPSYMRIDEIKPESELHLSTRQKTYPTPDEQWMRTVKYIYEIYGGTPWEYWLQCYMHKHQWKGQELTEDELQYLRVRWQKEQENGPVIESGQYLCRVVRRHKLLLIGDIFVMYRNNGMNIRFPAIGVSSKGVKLKNYYLQFRRSCKGTERHVVVELVELRDDLIGLRWDDPAVRRFVAELTRN